MKFREYKTSSGKKVLAGKTAKNNEELIGQIGDEEIVLHTKKPGSPFVNIKHTGRLSKKDIKEAALFCAAYSQAWKKAKIKKDVIVHYFKGKNVYKKKGMKLGTFGVKKFREIKVKKQDILDFKNE